MIAYQADAVEADNSVNTTGLATASSGADGSSQGGATAARNTDAQSEAPSHTKDQAISLLKRGLGATNTVLRIQHRTGLKAGVSGIADDDRQDHRPQCGDHLRRCQRAVVVSSHFFACCKPLLWLIRSTGHLPTAMQSPISCGMWTLMCRLSRACKSVIIPEVRPGAE